MPKTKIGNNYVTFFNDNDEEVFKIELDHTEETTTITILNENITIDHNLKTIDLGNFSFLTEEVEILGGIEGGGE